MRSKGQLRRSTSTKKLFIKEHLTARNNAIFYQARTARRYKIFHNVWTENGRVWATQSEMSAPELLRDAEVIEASIERAIGEGIEPTEFLRDDPPDLPPHVKHDRNIGAGRSRLSKESYVNPTEYRYRKKPVFENRAHNQWQESHRREYQPQEPKRQQQRQQPPADPHYWQQQQQQHRHFRPDHRSTGPRSNPSQHTYSQPDERAHNQQWINYETQYRPGYQDHYYPSQRQNFEHSTQGAHYHHNQEGAFLGHYQQPPNQHQYANQVQNASYANATSGQAHMNVHSISSFPSLGAERQPADPTGYPPRHRHLQQQYSVPVENRFSIFEDYPDY